MDIRIRKILCPIDFSENSEHAMQYALAFAQAYDAELVLLHVMSAPIYAVPADPMLPELSAEYMEAVEENGRKRLAEAAAEAGKHHSKVISRMASGVPFVHVIQTAKKENVDLIVMGTHGRTGLAHMLIGSVADKVVRKAPCPVLTVKHPEHEFVMP